MDALPQVGQKYQHKKWGEVEVSEVRKRGRGYQVYSKSADRSEVYGTLQIQNEGWERLKDFQKATKA